MNGTLDVTAEVLPGFNIVDTMIWAVCILVGIGIVVGISWMLFQMWD
jgi:hypothetical protein